MVECARAHLAGRDDGLVRVVPLIERVGLFVDLIGLETDQIPFAALREAESTGRPLGSDDFVAELEAHRPPPAAEEARP